MSEVGNWYATNPDLRKLLMLAGDVELNPGPICDCCSRTIAVNILTKAWQCSHEGCENRCHKGHKCSFNGSTLNHDGQSMWTCKLHRGPVSDQPEGLPGEEGPNQKVSCDSCTNTLYPYLLKTALKCSHPTCEKRCHVKKVCSGMSKAAKENLDWMCQGHRVDQPPPQPTPTEVDNQQVKEKIYCANRKCRVRGVLTTKVPVYCDNCKGAFHYTCTGLTRDGNAVAAKHGGYTCVACINKTKQQKFSNPTTKGVSEPTLRTRKSLRIMQWNCDGLNTKIPELKSRLVEDNIDVCFVQEAKIPASQEYVPYIPGYGTIPFDRLAARGGGLYTFLKDDVIFEPVSGEMKDATEQITIRVKMGKNDWVNLTNVYIPPHNSTGQDVIRPALEIIPTSESSIICGDFNGHSQLWDKLVQEENRGNLIELWMIANDLEILNNGEPTHINRFTTNKSTPDITLCGAKMRGKCEWSVCEGIGKSDHLPILITLNEQLSTQELKQLRAKWKRKDVNWEEFAADVENEISPLEEELDIKKRVARFHDILIRVGKKRVGKVKPGKRTKCFLTPTVKAAIKKRNRLRREARNRRSEWLTACEEAQKEIKKAKEECWKDFLEDVITSEDETKLWSTIKSLNGTPSTNSPNEAMSYQGKTITTSKEKANVFMKHYANISKLTLSKKDRNLNRNLKRKLDAPSAGSKHACDFTMHELKTAIRKMKAKGAAGADDIPPTFLKALGPLALAELLAIFNLSFHSTDIPQSWRDAIIIPLLKSGKAASELGSYRPISLTSCVVKLLERMIAERLYFMAESGDWFSSLQAGFRAGRSCEDQILRITQAIDDALNRGPDRSVLVLLDFSKAYDTVWREKLLMTMLQKGVPVEIVRWLRRFLENRQAKVELHGHRSRCMKLEQGLPQGSVLSPLLFLFYIDTLANELESMGLDDVVCSLFADDVSILASKKDKEVATATAQKLVDTVDKWSKRWKLQLNADKSEASFFTSSTTKEETTYKPTISLGGKTIKFEPTPRLLGVILDRSLSFGPQKKAVSEKARSKCKALRAVAHSKWGCRKKDLRKIFITVVRSVLDYAGPAWQPWLAPTGRSDLQRDQNYALRIVTGQYADTPVEALNLEAGVPQYTTIMDRNCVKAREKALRCPPKHPRLIAFTNEAPSRLTRSSCRRKAEELSTKLPAAAEDRLIPCRYAVPPWDWTQELEVYPTLPGIKGRNDSTEKKMEAAQKAIEKVDADIVVYTDGSASEGNKEGGAAAVVTCGDVVADVIMKRGRVLTCSYEEEKEALELVLNWIDNIGIEDKTVLIATDSQSLCQALLGSDPELAVLRNRIQTSPVRISIQWIPGHSEITGNEVADAAAKFATTLEGSPGAISYKSVASFINGMLKDPPTEHKRTKKVYSKFSIKTEAQIKTRDDEVLLAQLRSGKHKAFGDYKLKLDPNADTSCPLCKAPDYTLTHWLTKCKKLTTNRKRLFGRANPGLSVMSSHPLQTILLARETLTLEGGTSTGDATPASRQ